MSLQSGISPMYKGATAPAWSMALQDDLGNPPPSLVGATFSLNIHDATGAIPDRLATGTWTTLNAFTGSVLYQWATTDTAIPGSFVLQLTVTLSNGQVIIYDPVPWQIISL